MDWLFFVKSIFLGVALAMDACAVSMTNGLEEPKMRFPKVLFIALMFGIFQGGMPLIGYFVGHAVLKYIEMFIPWIALVLLLFLGIKMIIDGIKKKEETEELKKLTFLTIFIQAIATSIDALSVGFTFADYTNTMALVCVFIVAIVTTFICIVAVYIGKKFGSKLENKAVILGGIILIAIGLEIFISGMIG